MVGQEDREKLELLRAHVEERGYRFFEMSAVTHEGTRELVRECARLLAELPPILHYEADYVPPEPVVDTSEELTIEHFDDMWIVEGPWLPWNSVQLVPFAPSGWTARSSALSSPVRSIPEIPAIHTARLAACSMRRRANCCAWKT